MGNVIFFPGCGPLPSQRELVERATTILLREVMDVFVEHRVEPGKMEFWYNSIQTFLWASPIECDKNGNLTTADIKEWKFYWRERAMLRVSYLRPLN